MFEQTIEHDNGRLATDLLGFTAVDITDNPELVAQKLDELFGGLKAFVTAVTGEDETALETARQQMRSLQATLSKHGLASSENDDMAELPDKIQAAYQEDQAHKQQELADGLQELAQQIMLAATAVSQQIQTTAEKYNDTAVGEEIEPTG